MKAPEFVILSLENAESYKPRGIEICISITDPEAPHARLSAAFAAVLRLRFNDIVGPNCAPTDILFGEEHASAIIDFFAQWPHAERVVVHCMAGVSRSPGVALGICELRGWPTDALEQSYPHWNTRVRSELARRASGTSC
jgi:predicted protein tyrosine phosphatase